ncbi:uncharacterized protein ASPGLDRAFT_51117 [Aspergillus glaucus CBS 516.65]|uniref:Uncharacterized protein n=1 Tax=Aspergillus glaucus CBS 516.65 TaxID=1160497 RepID=A0A1L9V9Z5_ASPGL|nr:hypothetical protein ASPGLDRAFT_51117 [Aspergillus glaucus CBS 516.65]OJJ80705.1 hypothetical protein ASPGLDRAFT_51117 [Aspergillus glaucus CBS 516.65]
MDFWAMSGEWSVGHVRVRLGWWYLSRADGVFFRRENSATLSFHESSCSVSVATTN